MQTARKPLRRINSMLNAFSYYQLMFALILFASSAAVVVVVVVVIIGMHRADCATF